LDFKFKSFIILNPSAKVWLFNKLKNKIACEDAKLCEIYDKEENGNNN